mmetsp:Transcript_74466/g.112207  ORF Transcript_74466/g.112207 Transcript_74466/m.112207 type:complete len:96 (+) Transcript_74466:494-781(+)
MIIRLIVPMKNSKKNVANVEVDQMDQNLLMEETIIAGAKTNNYLLYGAEIVMRVLILDYKKVWDIANIKLSKIIAVIANEKLKFDQMYLKLNTIL